MAHSTNQLLERPLGGWTELQTGDRIQEAGERRLGDRIWETLDRRWKTGAGRNDTDNKRSETGDGRQEMGEWGQAGDKSQERVL